ncbi:hypothetical protein KOR34_15680 [Posidoniimonas corsicana]|uniref:Uncharacterized protein n=1 Tax=Posidoniimonas corsicana TaxID=1938618 RepID=A0A5C5VFF8_9BACT|nr:hypothetical protein [Posidoniimonas corsicana]TWT36629.1 hypothetical protein KOR34_15680 [Posidoniimonas corsicana]
MLVDSHDGTEEVFLYASGGEDEETDIEKKSAVDDILDDLDEAPRSTISFLARHQGSHADVYAAGLLEKIGDDLDEYDHSADLIASLLRRTTEWKKHVEWFGKTASQLIASETWTVPSWARMFPEERVDCTEHLRAREIFQGRFETSIQRSFVPLAAQRLAVWNGDSSIGLFEDYLNKNSSTMHPCSFRACLLASLDAGKPEADVLMLAELSQDRQLVQMLKWISSQGHDNSDRP